MADTNFAIGIALAESRRDGDPERDHTERGRAHARSGEMELALASAQLDRRTLATAVDAPRLRRGMRQLANEP